MYEKVEVCEIRTLSYASCEIVIIKKIVTLHLSIY
jgi:hypothetical protein